MTSRTDPFSAPVAADNPGRRATRPARRDPDGDTAAAAPHQPDPTPDPTPDPAPPQPQPQPGPAPAPHTEPRAAAVAATGGGTLSSVLTNGSGPTAGVDSVTMLAGLASMRRRPVDPMADYTPDGTRKLRWVQAAIRQYAMLTGRTTQEVETAALVGGDPIPDDVLDANWLDCYGYPREQYNPQAYR